MAFNPALPQTNSPVSSAELRAQFTALKDLIDQRPTQNEAETLVTSHSAANVDAVEPLSMGISDPPSQGDVQGILDKLNELIGLLHHN